MIHVNLPQPPAGFVEAGEEEQRKYRAFLKEARAAAKKGAAKRGAAKKAAAAKKGAAKSGKAGKDAKKIKKSFTFAVYGTARDALLKAFEGKCSYCEDVIASNQPGDVEHYRPKGGVLVGKELKQPGYDWLAAAWDNLLISCADCNRARKQEIKGLGRVKAGKANQFPLADEKARARTPKKVEAEVPLLINPYLEDPEKLLTFVVDEGNDVLVKPAHKSGLARRKAEKSIEVYALQRHGLVTSRSELAINIMMEIQLLIRMKERLEKDPGNQALEDTLIEGVEDLKRKYLAARKPYTAMARCLIDPFLKAMSGAGRTRPRPRT